MRHALDAVSTFLDLAPAVTRAEAVNLDRLREPVFWQDLHKHVHDRLRFILSLLDDLAGERDTAFRFDQEVRLGASIQEALAPLAGDFAAKRIEVANLVPEALPPLLVDQRRFQKLFSLLLRHELSTLPDGSIVRFEAAAKVGADGQAEEMDIFVTDNGAGIAPEAILSLFDPLLVGAGPGTDSEMYLMAVYFIVYHHGGRVQVGHRTGKGLALTLTLPLRPQSVERRDEARDFLVRAMTNERLWDRLLAGM